MPGRHSAFSRPGRWAPETKALTGTLPGLQDNYKRQPVSLSSGSPARGALPLSAHQEKDTSLHITDRDVDTKARRRPMTSPGHRVPTQCICCSSNAPAQ